MEDMKTDPMEVDSAAAPAAAAAQSDNPAEAMLGVGLEGAATTGSLSETTNLLANAGPPSPLTGCYLLIVIGEPHSEEALRVIVEQLKQGKCVWRLITK